MSDVDIRIEGCTGRITLDRPKALNALTLEMIDAMAATLPVWAADDRILVVMIDGAGDRAFCAGGDIADIYAALAVGDPEVARAFWRAEYRLNAMLFSFPKPVVTFLNGFTMGGGVGVGCHASHRIVSASSQIAMPEVSIGLVPDVGGSLLLARAPGHVGAYLGTTATRTTGWDAIFAGFADHFIVEERWDALKAHLVETGDCAEISRWTEAPSQSDLQRQYSDIEHFFSSRRLTDIAAALDASDSHFAVAALKKLRRHAPLAMAGALDLVHRAKEHDRIEVALRDEFRATYRLASQGDFREGIRAAIIDRDRAPVWAHKGPDAVTDDEVAALLAPLGVSDLSLEGAH